MALRHILLLRLFSSKLICCKDFTQSVQLHNTGSETYEDTAIQKQFTVPLLTISTTKRFIFLTAGFFFITVGTIFILTGHLLVLAVTILRHSVTFLYHPPTFYALKENHKVPSVTILGLSGGLKVFFSTKKGINSWKKAIKDFFKSINSAVTALIFRKAVLFSGKFVLSKQIPFIN